MKFPLVSVIVPTHNRAHYLGQALASLRDQTLRDIEIVVVDDGSTDDTRALLAAFDDPRLVIVRHAVNRGIPAARNSGLERASGRYVAWLDSDDVSRPDRLARQAAYLDGHSETAMIGCCAGKIDPVGRRISGTRIPPFENGAIQAWLLFRSAFQQSSIMGRGEILKAFPYRPENPVCEDYDVFLRLGAAGHRLENLPLVLIDRRIHPDQTVRLSENVIPARTAVLLAPVLTRLGVPFSPEDLDRHVLLGNLKASTVGEDFLIWSHRWIAGLHAANAVSGCYDSDSLGLATSYFWLRACKAALRTIGMRRSAQWLIKGLSVTRLANSWPWSVHAARVTIGESMASANRGDRTTTGDAHPRPHA